VFRIRKRCYVVVIGQTITGGDVRRVVLTKLTNLNIFFRYRPDKIFHRKIESEHLRCTTKKFHGRTDENAYRCKTYTFFASLARKITNRLFSFFYSSDRFVLFNAFRAFRFPSHRLLGEQNYHYFSLLFGLSTVRDHSHMCCAVRIFIIIFLRTLCVYTDEPDNRTTSVQHETHYIILAAVAHEQERIF